MNIEELIDAVARTRKTTGRTPDQLVGKLSAALAEFTSTTENQSFAARFSPTGNYMRLLLNRPEDEFQIVLVFWGPGKGSPIHDHDGTIGVVSALTSQVKEVKYRVTDRNESGVSLAEHSNFLITPNKITAILPEDDKQLHLMMNDTGSWAATVHVYLTAIHRYRLYEPRDEGRYQPVETDLWFDRINVGREMPKGPPRGSTHTATVDAPVLGAATTR